ncbi:MAG: glycosyltransferase family 2 protein [archaeon]
MIAVIIPCLNEEGSIGNVIISARYALKKSNLKSKIIVVDDFSDDASLTKITEADIIIPLKERMPVAEVIKVGINEAMKLKPDIIIHMDADGQHNPEDIPKLINPISEGKADMVIGSRFLCKNKISHRAENLILTRLVNMIAKTHLTDTQSGFRAIRYNILQKIPLISKFTYTQEEVIKAARLGCRIKEIPIKVLSRKHGRSRISGNTLNYAAKAGFDLIRIMLNN